MFLRGAGIILASLQSVLSLRGQGWDTSLVLPGCESLAHGEGYLWAFSYDRRAAIEDTVVTGHLFRLRGGDSLPFLWEVTPPGRWHPFGLAYRSPFLWFLHGPRERPTEVWRFTWTGEKLQNPRTWRHPGFVSLQAICPIDSVRFFVANDRSHRSRWHLVAGYLIRRVRSSIYLCDPDTCRKIADRIPYASGIAYLPAQRWLLVAVAFRRRLWVYAGEGDSQSFRYVRPIKLPGHPDNLTPISDTVIWAVCHHNLSRWARSLALGRGHSPWSLVEIRFSPEGAASVRTLYTRRRGYSTASMALPMGPYVYVGSVFEPHLLRLKAAEAIPADALPSSTDDFPVSRPAQEKQAR
jgi:hypothetical protein